MYVAGRTHHRPTGPEGTVPIAQENSSLPRSSGLPMVGDSREGVGRLDLPEEAFQRGAPYGVASPHVPGPVDDASGALPVDLRLSPPSHCPVRAFRRTSGPSTHGPTPSPTAETRLAALPAYETGIRGTHKAFPDAGGDDWRYPAIQAVRAFQRWSTCLRAVGRNSQREPRPPRPSRTRKASQLTGYLNASG